MKEARLEHANLTVSNPDAMAAILCSIFDWTVRWSGESMNNGYTVHVGNTSSYLAIYTHDDIQSALESNDQTIKNLNHLGIVVQNLKAVESKVLTAGYKPHNHRHYENKGAACGPSSNFYFHTLDNLEIEVISYT